MNKNSVFILLLFLANLNFAVSQEMQEYTRDFKYNDGIYLSLDEFKNNKPSIPLPEVIEGGRNQLGNTVCMKKLEYIHNDSIFEIRAKEVWGICMNGNPYIRYDEGNLFPAKPCFFKLLSIGSITTFYMQKVENKDTWNNHNYNAMRQMSPSKVKVFQYALEVETGKTFNQTSDADKIIALIRKDDFFKDKKMKKKEVGVYITQYNKRNPFYVPLD